MESALRSCVPNDIDSQTRSCGLTIGVKLCQALIDAFVTKDFARATQVLLHIRSSCFRVGGSHAQRDVFDQTLLFCALQSHQWDIAYFLVRQRLNHCESIVTRYYESILSERDASAPIVFPKSYSGSLWLPVLARHHPLNETDVFFAKQSSSWLRWVSGARTIILMLLVRSSTRLFFSSPVRLFRSSAALSMPNVTDNVEFNHIARE